MAHVLERGHGQPFIELMDKFMPDWGQRREELDDGALAHEDWA